MPRELENAIIEFLTHLFQSVGWFGVFLGMAIESAAIPLPSEVIMPLAGWLLIQAKGDPISYALIAGLAGALGCVAGSLVTYYIGALGGRPLLLKYGKYIFINQHHIDLADKWFAERGEATAFVSRLLPVVRTFISIPAGIARMNVLRFTVYTFVGSFLWCTALAAGGWYFGSRWEDLRNVMRPFDYPIAAIVLVLLIFVFVRGWQSARRRALAGPTPAPVAVVAATHPVTNAPISATPAAVKRPGDSASLGFHRPQRNDVNTAVQDALPERGETAPPAVTARIAPARPPVQATVAPETAPPPRAVTATKPGAVPPPPMPQNSITQTRSPMTGSSVGNQRDDNGDIYSWFGGQPPQQRR